MKINKLEPQSYCHGVKNAINKANIAINDPNNPKPIYFLGSIIHNQFVNQSFIDSGAIIIEKKNTTRYDLLDQIDTGTVVFSAHGVSPRVYHKALAKGLNIIDTTCGNVKVIQKRISEHLDKGYKCLYIGTKGHPEAEGILEINENIILIENINDIPNTLDNQNIYVTNQTTLSILDTEIIYNKLKELYPNAVIDNRICNATTLRQKAVLNQEKVDLCIVVGDPTSSNTKKLAAIAQQASIPVLFIQNVKELKNHSLASYNQISITSGASTPMEIVDEIIEYINENHP